MFIEENNQEGKNENTSKPKSILPVCPLTKRQMEIVWLFSKSKKNKDVARILGIRYDTARTHRRNIFARLHCNGKHEAVEIAKQNNWWGFEEMLKGINL